jgi:hypothetical protein
MTEIRSWLDEHKIQTTAFGSKSIAGVFHLDIGFQSRNEAQLFKRDFRLGDVYHHDPGIAKPA